MPKRYIFDPDNFDGNCLSTIETTTGKISYTEMSWDQFNAAHGGNLRALGWMEFSTKWLEPYHISLQKPWRECTEAEYDYALGCLPPLQHCGIAGFDTFYSGEATTAHLHQMFAHRGNRYWTALRSLLRSTDELAEELSQLVNFIGGYVESFDGQELRIQNGHVKNDGRNLEIESSKIVLYTTSDNSHQFAYGESWTIHYIVENERATVISAHLITKPYVFPQAR